MKKRFRAREKITKWFSARRIAFITIMKKSVRKLEKITKWFSATRIAFITLLATILAAIIAVAIARIQYSVTVEHNRRSTQAKLYIESSSDADAVNLILRNGGFGPATITGYKFLIDGREVATNTWKYVLTETGILPICNSHRDSEPEPVLNAGESMELVSLDGGGPLLTGLFARIDLIIDYTSTYGSPKRISLKGNAKQSGVATRATH